MRVDEGVRVRVRAVLGGTALAALVLGSLTAPARAADPEPVECPQIMAESAITTGTIGEGETVVQGTTPEPFQVEVLGIIDDGISAGHDLVLIKVSDLPGRSVIAQGGGTWEGISGSPVYVDGKLMGAVSYGVTLAPSTIAGLTPAADMADVLGLPASSSTPTAAANKVTAKKVPLSASLRRTVAARTGVSVPSGTLAPLVTPLAVSGITGANLKRFQADLTAAGRSYHVYAAGRPAASAVSAAPTLRPVAGGNFASLLSYGDVTMGGVGTTTYVCGNQALAFGHPMQFAGPSTYGANEAPALAIIKDDTLGSYKQSNIGGSFGTVDQDRLTAVRADLSKSPTSASITTNVFNDDTGRSRTGTTQVVERDLVPEVSLYAALANYDNTFDEAGDGRATATWSISGTRAGGRPFYVARADKWADRSDVTFDPALDLASAADAVLNDSAEKVTIDKVAFRSDISTVYKALSLTKVEVSVNGGAYRVVKALAVKPGDVVAVRSTLTAFQSTASTTTTSKVRIPGYARGSSGVLSVSGGQTLADNAGGDDGDSSCLIDGSCDDLAPVSLDTVIKGLNAPPRHDVLITTLSVNDDQTDATSVLGRTTASQAEVVTGSKNIRVSVRG